MIDDLKEQKGVHGICGLGTCCDSAALIGFTTTYSRTTRGLPNAAQVIQDRTNCGLRILPFLAIGIDLALTLLAVSCKGALSPPIIEPDL